MCNFDSSFRVMMLINLKTKVCYLDIALQNLTKLKLMILVVLIGATSLAHSEARGIIKERVEYMKASKDSLKKIKVAIADENYDAIIHLASEIARWSKKMPDYFPSGSNGNPSKASPGVWSDFDGFKAAAHSNEQAAMALVEAALSKNKDALAINFDRTFKTCKSCHKTYLSGY